MHIIAIRPAPPGSGKTVARFDAELSPGIKAYDLKLVDANRGYRVFGPSLGGGAAVTFSPEIADKLVELVKGKVARNDNRNAA